MWDSILAFMKSWWVPIVLVGIFLVAVASCQPSNASSFQLAADRECVSIEAETAEAASAGFKVTKTFTEAEAGAFLAALNNIPPLSALRGDTVIVFAHPNEEINKVGIVIFNEGCRAQRGFVHKVVLDRILNTMPRYLS